MNRRDLFKTSLAASGFGPDQRPRADAAPQRLAPPNFPRLRD